MWAETRASRMTQTRMTLVFSLNNNARIFLLFLLFSFWIPLDPPSTPHADSPTLNYSYLLLARSIVSCNVSGADAFNLFNTLRHRFFGLAGRAMPFFHA